MVETGFLSESLNSPSITSELLYYHYDSTDILQHSVLMRTEGHPTLSCNHL